MADALYAVPSALITLVLLGLMAGCTELGHRLGRARAPASTEAYRDHVTGIQAAMLGLAALLLAFTFSLALQRFDSRSEAVVEEANAIGTAFLRVDLLPPSFQDEARAAIGRYLDVRVQEALLPLPDLDARSRIGAVAATTQASLWSVATRAARSEPGARAPLLFAEAVNQLIDSYGRRSAASSRHVPVLVLSVLFVTFLLAAAIVGYAAGVANHRPALVTYLLVGLMVVLVFIVLDLDRPRRGIIQVSHASLLELQATVQGGLPGGRRLAPDVGGK